MLRGLARERANDRGVVDASTMFGYVAEQLRGTGQEAVSFGYGRALRIVDYRSSINSLNLVSQNNPSRNIKNISKSVIHWSLILLACISGFGVFQLVNTNNKNRSSYCPNNIKISDQIITIGIADFGKQNNQTNNIETDIELELRNKLQYPFVRICRIKSTVTSPIEAKNSSEDWSDILGKNGLIIWGNETRIGIVMLNNTYTSPQPLTIDSNINTFYIAKLVMLTTSYHLIRLVKDENEKLNIINTSLLFIEKDRIKLENIFPQELSKIYYRTGQLLTSINSLDNSCDKVVEKCQEAIQAFQNVIRVDPENYEAIYLVGILAQNLKRYDLALQKYNQLISSSTQKRLLESLTRRAEILLEQKNYVDVEKDLARLSNSYPTQGRIAKIQIRIDREYQIEKIYEDLDYLAKVKLEEENYLDIGNIYFRLRRFDKHRNYFEEKLLCKIDLLKLEKILENYNQSEPQADVKEFSKKLKSKKQVCA